MTVTLTNVSVRPSYSGSGTSAGRVSVVPAESVWV